MIRKKNLLFVAFYSILLLFILSGCQTGKEFTAQKFLVVSSKDLKEKGNIPDAVYYSEKYEKMAVAYRNIKNKKLLGFYDMTGEKPIFYFETPYADDVIEPRFAKNFNMSYGLLYGSTWKIFLRTMFAKEPIQVLSAESLREMILKEKTLTVIILGEHQGKYGIFPSLSKDANYTIVENLVLVDNKIFFKAMKPDGNWIIFLDDKEGEPYSFVSRLAFSEKGEIAYIARDLENDWVAVAGDKKIALEKQYQEIGQVFVHDGKIYFSGVEKDENAWEIAKNNKTVIKNLMNVPAFIVRVNGDIAYVETSEKGSRVISDEEPVTGYLDQIDQLMEAGGNLFAKIKNKFGLWQVISGSKKSDQYVWMSEMFRNSKDDVFFLGLTPNSDFEFFKFQHE